MKIDNIFKQAFCTYNIYKAAYRTTDHGFGYVFPLMSAFLIKIWDTKVSTSHSRVLGVLSFQKTFSTAVKFSQTRNQNKLLNICKPAYQGLNIRKEAYACL